MKAFIYWTSNYEFGITTEPKELKNIRNKLLYLFEFEAPEHIVETALENWESKILLNYIKNKWLKE